MNPQPKKLTSQEVDDLRSYFLEPPFATEATKEIEQLFNHISTLELENEELKWWIREDGERTDTCTYNILKEICNGCRCQRMPKEPNE